MIDKHRSHAYLKIMRLLTRLAMLCLSLALFGGMMLHDAASARMSLEMAEAERLPDPASETACPACGEGAPQGEFCDFDCTAPAFVAATVQGVSVPGFTITRRAVPRDPPRRGLDPGADPFPPRSVLRG